MDEVTVSLVEQCQNQVYHLTQKVATLGKQAAVQCKSAKSVYSETSPL